jgi:hypothetical protein
MWLPYHRRPNSLPLYKRRPRGEEEAIPGFLLKHPKIDILHPENKNFGDIEIGHASMQGYRVNMEDEHVIDQLSLKDHLIVAIMDGQSVNFFFLYVDLKIVLVCFCLCLGHAGTYAAKYTARNLKAAVESTDEWSKYVNSKHKSKDVELLGQALLQAYLEIDQELLEMTQAGIMVSENVLHFSQLVSNFCLG